MSQGYQDVPLYVSRSTPRWASGYHSVMSPREHGQRGWHRAEIFSWSATHGASDASTPRYARLLDEGTSRRSQNLTASHFEPHYSLDNVQPTVGYRASQFVAREWLTRRTDERSTSYSMQDETSKLNKEDQGKALKMLRKEWYNPTPKLPLKNVNLYYRDLPRDATHRTVDKRVDEDDAKRCAVCLDDFERGSEVMVTPCNHMFHEDCIVPWVKSHRQCPVCRFAFCKPVRDQGTYAYGSEGSNSPGDDGHVFLSELLWVIRVMDEAFP